MRGALALMLMPGLLALTACQSISGSHAYRGPCNWRADEAGLCESPTNTYLLGALIGAR